MHVAPFLIAAVAGYWVLERAERQRGRLQRIGRAIGWLVVLLSFAGVACGTYYKMSSACPPGKMGCPFKGAPAMPLPAQ